MKPMLLQRLPAPSPPPAVQRQAPLRPRRSDGRIFALGFAASLLLHLLLIVVAPRLFVSPPPTQTQSTGSVREEVAHRGMRVERIRPVADVAVEDPASSAPPPDPVLPTPIQPPAPVPGTGVVADPGAAPRPLTSGAAERLRPQAVDPRLWAPLPPRSMDPRDPVDVMRGAAHARIEALNDSLRLDAEARQRALDWTVRTADGRRWGVSPDGIHLGDVTLPAPMFGPSPGRRDEVNARLRDWSDIQHQAGRAETRAIIDDRVRAIRERNRTVPPDSQPPPR